MSTSVDVSVVDFTPSVRLFGVAGRDLEPALAVSQSFRSDFRRAVSAACSVSLSEL